MNLTGVPRYVSLNENSNNNNNNNNNREMADDAVVVAALAKIIPTSATTTNGRGGVDPSLDDPSGYTLVFVYSDALLNSLMELEPVKAFKLIKHYVYDSKERSVTMSKVVLRLTMQQTHKKTKGSLPNYFKVLQMLVMLEERGVCNELVETRMEIVLPPMMERVQRLIDRRVVFDDVFVHLTMKLILWCVGRRAFARRLLMAANADSNNYERVPEWTIWDRLWKEGHRSQKKQEKQRREYEERNG